MPDNSTAVKVGKLIALVVEKGEDWKNVEVPKIEEQISVEKSSVTRAEEEKVESDKHQLDQSQYVIISH